MDPLVPVPAGARLVLVYGGTFDPPHRAHFELPEFARRAIDADWVVYVPAGRSPFKSGAPTAGDEHRVTMLERGLAGSRHASVSPIELRAERADSPSYTVQTLGAFRHRLPAQTRMRLLIGSDQAESFHKWKEARRVIELAEPVVLLRDPHQGPDDLITRMAPHWEEEELTRWRDRIIDAPRIEVSATRIRHLLARRDAQAWRELEGLLPEPVIEYIREQGLYQDARS